MKISGSAHEKNIVLSPMLDDLGVIEVTSLVIPVNSSDRPEVTKFNYTRVLCIIEKIYILDV